ncbi:hypothetical protein [Streptomyces sp. NBC_00401]|uniref:hypothetical protein n=1 Tax=unclassified Streptomyces TaxID=2593676 RepID=UPI00224D2454|nr:hypothetical protein [Streptomyces sp. NBC_00401]MCX5083806.1 hypothetical protein [Streptomyces sp. NBC_00401]
MDDLALDCSTDFAVPEPPAALLPLLTVGEAQDVLEILAAVANHTPANADLARTLLMNLAARVPSRD